MSVFPLFRRQAENPLIADYASSPKWPTTLKEVVDDEVLIGADPTGRDRISSVWLCRSVPLAQIIDYNSESDVILSARGINDMNRELAALSGNTMNLRRVSQNSYRQVHMLLVNIPRRYYAPAAQPLKPFFDEVYRNQTVDDMLLLAMVRLESSAFNRQAKLMDQADALARIVVSGRVTVEDFDQDRGRIADIMDRVGMERTTTDEIMKANAWWNWGRWADTIIFPHFDHFHSFESSASAEQAKLMGFEHCERWAGDFRNHIPGEISNVQTFTMAGIKNMHFPRDGMEAMDPQSRWINRLMTMGATACSVRYSVEPASITERELRLNRRRFVNDQEDAVKHGGEESMDREDRIIRAQRVQDYYDIAGDHADATLHNLSTVVAFDGKLSEQELSSLRTRSHSLAEPVRLERRQTAALAETMLCSPARANPHVKDLPSSALAYSGIQSRVSMVGKPDQPSAQLGFTETNSQPAYLSPASAWQEDTYPYLAIIGGTGSGKTMASQWLALCFAMLKRRGTQENLPVIFINPKQGSDLTPIADIAKMVGAGGHVMNLDDIASADGILDPIRTSMSAEQAINFTVSMLSNVLGLGAGNVNEDVLMNRVVSYGVHAGGKCVMEALRLAVGEVPGWTQEQFDRIQDFVSSTASASALFGTNPQSPALRVSSGLTVIQVRDSSIQISNRRDTVTERLNNQIFTALVLASQSAVTKREGVIFFDEAHYLFNTNAKEMLDIGRIAREQSILPVIMTQKAQDAVAAGLKPFISQSILLHNEEDEAEAECLLASIEPTKERVSRIAAPRYMTGSRLNWNSMMSLREKNDRGDSVTRRGSVAYYVDLSRRVTPVTIALPEWFVFLASTNPDEVRERNRRIAAGEDLLPPEIRASLEAMRYSV